MNWYRYFTALSFALCAISLLYHLIRLIRLGRPQDYASPRGNPQSGIAYSFLGAMNPAKKESAYLHLPTYAAGLIYHLGTFMSVFLAFIFFFEAAPAGVLRILLLTLISLSCLSGCVMFVKRLLSKNLRFLSVPDDYISNLLVTLFQVFTVGMLADLPVAPVYFSLTGILFLYIPVGKLKHALYFFAARYHLGLFYGRRGVWPVANRDK